MNTLENFIKHKDDMIKLFIKAEDETVRRSTDIFCDECKKLGIPKEIAMLYLQYIKQHNGGR